MSNEYLLVVLVVLILVAPELITLIRLAVSDEDDAS